VGRFAPSPTGELHVGSLLAAVGSYLDARHHGGRWLVRIEDLDRARVVPGSAARILRTLETYGLNWDGEVLTQSERTELYAAAAERLTRLGLTFECSCSRRRLQELDDQGYPGTCRRGPTAPGPTATRFRLDQETPVRFEDRLQGPCTASGAELGDVVIRRRDGLYAYQLAVVVDDDAQGVTDVVRGADLLPSTAWQIELQRALGLPRPRYAHLPLVVEPDGSKLAKARRSAAADRGDPAAQLLAILGWLRQAPPGELTGEPPGTVLRWAARHWNPDALRGLKTLPAPG
jgi:glutamyl-Q tRNA(Asp) synthetase